MKINWKVLATAVLMVGAVAWAVSSTRSVSYSGTKLDFEVGNGTVTMMNPSEESFPVRLVAESSRSFYVTSTIADAPRASVREGERPDIINLIAFELPPGESEFTVTRGLDVSFVADTSAKIEATVHATNVGAKTKWLVAFILAAAAYMSFTTEHDWFYKLRGTKRASKLHSAPYTGEYDKEMRSYGDNRAK